MDTALLGVGKNHADAILALYAGVGYSTFRVEVTDDTLTYPYLCVYPDPGVAAFDSLAASTSTLTVGWQVTAVGRDAVETSAALDAARAVSHGARPQVSGRVCGLVTQVPGTPPGIRQDPSARDPATARPVFYAVAQFTFTSAPG